VNVGYAALTMNADIGLSANVFGLDAGIFFVGYFLFEVPSNLLCGGSAHACGSRGF
jgi:ACS family tartrate transporter-like MFS transporter